MESWIQVDKTSGSGNGVVKITLEPNPNETPRTAFLTIKTTSSIKTFLNIKQLGMKNYTMYDNPWYGGDAYNETPQTTTNDIILGSEPLEDLILVSPSSMQLTEAGIIHCELIRNSDNYVVWDYTNTEAPEDGAALGSGGTYSLRMTYDPEMNPDWPTLDFIFNVVDIEGKVSGKLAFTYIID